MLIGNSTVESNCTNAGELTGLVRKLFPQDIRNIKLYFQVPTWVMDNEHLNKRTQVEVRCIFFFFLKYCLNFTNPVIALFII